jgi:hypothetical protein
MIADKAASLAEAKSTIDRCIASFEALQNQLPAEPYAYLRFKLERTRRELQFRTHAMLAYMLGCRRLYSDNEGQRNSLATEIDAHLRAIDALADQADAEPPVTLQHRGRSFEFDAWPPHMRLYPDNLRAHFGLADGYEADADADTRATAGASCD